jgi:hypothetical protein
LNTLAQAGRRKGVSPELLRANLDALEKLLPELTPDVNKMRAADWVTLAKDVNHVAGMLVTLKSLFPGRPTRGALQPGCCANAASPAQEQLCDRGVSMVLRVLPALQAPTWGALWHGRQRCCCRRPRASSATLRW